MGGAVFDPKKKTPRGSRAGVPFFKKNKPRFFFGVDKKLCSLVLGGVGDFKYLFECSPGKVGKILHFDSYFSNWVGNKKQPRTVLQPHFFPYWKKADSKPLPLDSPSPMKGWPSRFFTLSCRDASTKFPKMFMGGLTLGSRKVCMPENERVSPK